MTAKLEPSRGTGAVVRPHVGVPEQARVGFGCIVCRVCMREVHLHGVRSWHVWGFIRMVCRSGMCGIRPRDVPNISHAPFMFVVMRGWGETVKMFKSQDQSSELWHKMLFYVVAW